MIKLGRLDLIKHAILSNNKQKRNILLYLLLSNFIKTYLMLIVKNKTIFRYKVIITNIIYIHDKLKYIYGNVK